MEKKEPQKIHAKSSTEKNDNVWYQNQTINGTWQTQYATSYYIEW